MRGRALGLDSKPFVRLFANGVAEPLHVSAIFFMSWALTKYSLPASDPIVKKVGTHYDN